MDLSHQIRGWLAEQDVPAYLVGGCVRDLALGRAVYDMDVVVAGDGLALARQLADRFHGTYYALDEKRGTGRAILGPPHRGRMVVDVSRFRGPDLAADLAGRDFTVNALAVDVRAPAAMIDLHGGLADLRACVLRPVSEASIRDDPLRALRAVRLAAELAMSISQEAEELIRRDGIGLERVSGERIRDELVRIVILPSAASSLGRMDDLGLLCTVFPELEPLRGAMQPFPHHLDALAHSLATVGALEQLLEELSATRKVGDDLACPGATGDSMLVRVLGQFADRILGHVWRRLGNGRPRLAILKLAALLHDTGKPVARRADEEGHVRFRGHDRDGARIAAEALRRLRLTSGEIRLGETIVRHHMRPLLLARQDEVSARAVYRWYRDTGQAGVEVLLHSLADHQATVLPGSPDEMWPRLLGLVGRMLSDYWEHTVERVIPPRLVDGTDLLRAFDLQPGRQVGELLEEVREAQVSGEVRTRQEALELVRRRLTGGP